MCDLKRLDLARVSLACPLYVGDSSILRIKYLVFTYHNSL